VVRQSGLDVAESKRWHLGTTWRFVLRPRRAQHEENGQMGESDSGGGGDAGVKNEAGNWWTGWISSSVTKNS